MKRRKCRSALRAPCAAVLSLALLVMATRRVVVALDPSDAEMSHPFRHLAAWLQQVEPELEDVKAKALSRGITVLSNSQRTLKSFDGAAHALYGSSRSTSDVASLRKEASLYEDPSKDKEADELIELLLVIRKTLLAAEWIECGCAEDNLALERMESAGLEPLPILLKKAVDPLREGEENGQNQANHSNNGDTVTATLATAEEESSSSTESGPPIDDEQPTEVAGLFSFRVDPADTQDSGSSSSKRGLLTCRPLVAKKRRCVVLSFADNLTGVDLLKILYAKPQPVALASHGLVEETMLVLPSVLACATRVVREVGPLALRWRDKMHTDELPYRIECVGHSFAGAVAAAVAAMLDGALTLRKGVDLDGEESAPGFVSCTSLGCPPCFSRSVSMPFVTSFVLGDDLIPRTSYKSLKRLKKRLLLVIPRRGGIAGKLSQGFALGSSLVTDVAGVTFQSVKQHSTALESDNLSLPGEVWFIKPRLKKRGATMAQTMTGSLREDMLWQVHDIMLTKSMLSHHALRKYVEVLDRV